MISVIICSIDAELRQNLIRNIAESIGVEHEVIAYDNSLDSYGICKVYNLCAEKSKYDYLCFVHEDIRFLSPDWGKELIDNTSSNTGIIGLAGGMVKTVYPVSWGDVGKNYARCNYYELYKGKQVHCCNNPDSESYSGVILLDGLFLFTRKSVWKENKFDESTFQRFHLYDQDFSFQIAQNYTNLVCHTISLLHFSRGAFNREWFDESVKFCRKWEAQLPSSLVPLPSKEWKKINSRALYVLIKRYLIKNEVDRSLINSYLYEFCKKYPFDVRIISLLIKYLIKRLCK